MIRFNKGIEVKTDRNGNHSIVTDMGQTFKTSLVSLKNIEESPSAEEYFKSMKKTQEHISDDEIQEWHNEWKTLNK